MKYYTDLIDIQLIHRYNEGSFFDTYGKYVWVILQVRKSLLQIQMFFKNLWISLMAN